MGILVLAFLLFLFVFLFAREVKMDQKRLIRQDEEGDIHIMREIEKFKKLKGLLVAESPRRTNFDDDSESVF